MAACLQGKEPGIDRWLVLAERADPEEKIHQATWINLSANQWLTDPTVSPSETVTIFPLKD
jgi:hypothetical protein